jgi:SAM-dependent methyltransferase
MYLKDAFIRTGKDILIRFPKKVLRSVEFVKEFKRFRSLSDDRFSIKVKDVYPCLTDKIKFTPFDQHYTYHPAWAARKLAQIQPKEHVDISSILSFSTIVSAFIPVRFYDYRPAELNLRNLGSDAADLTDLPFEDGSIESLSCMHTIEHIGLGRYGDQIDPKGDLKAINELKRVLKPGGDLLFVTPVGKPRVEYNAHRIYSFEQIVNYFSPFTLKEFSMVPDVGGFFEDANPKLVQEQQYGCGCFWFKNDEHV